MDVGKSTVRVTRRNLGLTHCTNLLESDVITFSYIPKDIFFTEDTVSTTQRNYTNIKLNYVSLHYFYNSKNGVHLCWQVMVISSKNDVKS